MLYFRSCPKCRDGTLQDATWPCGPVRVCVNCGCVVYEPRQMMMFEREGQAFKGSKFGRREVVRV